MSLSFQSIKDHRWTQKVLDLFRQGLSPKELAQSISAGALVGILPLFGVSTVIITAIAVRFKLNLPLAVFATYVVGPIHLLLFIPFIKVGEQVYGVKHVLLSIASIREAFSISHIMTFQDLGLEVICGLTGWAITAVPGAIILYFLLRWMIEIIKPDLTHE